MWNEIFDKLIINDKEIIEFNRHLKLKGYKRYKYLYDYSIREKHSITYIELSHYYRYDIKLRRVLYKTITLVEVSLKAMISNNYIIENIDSKNFQNKFRNVISSEIKFNKNERKKIREIIKKNRASTLFEILEHCEMGLLFKIIRKIDKSIINNYYQGLTISNKILDRARKLRNHVYHHNILFTSYLDHNGDSSIGEEIKLLFNLVPIEAKENLIKDIDNCKYIDYCYEKNEENTYRISKKDIVCLEV